MALNDEIENLLLAFGVDMTKDLQKSLASKGSQFANSRLYGALGQSFDNIVVFKDNTFTITFKIPDYYYWVDKGRQPGPVAQSADKKIEEWGNSRGYIGKFMDNYPKTNLKQRLKQQAEAKQKNSKRKKWKKLTEGKRPSFQKAKKQFVFLVKRKVARDGYSSKAKGFFTDVFADGRIDALTKALSDITGKNIAIEILRK